MEKRSNSRMPANVTGEPQSLFALSHLRHLWLLSLPLSVRVLSSTDTCHLYFSSFRRVVNLVALPSPFSFMWSGDKSRSQLRLQQSCCTRANILDALLSSPGCSYPFSVLQHRLVSNQSYEGQYPRALPTYEFNFQCLAYILTFPCNKLQSSLHAERLVWCICWSFKEFSRLIVLYWGYSWGMCLVMVVSNTWVYNPYPPWFY